MFHFHFYDTELVPFSLFSFSFFVLITELCLDIMTSLPPVQGDTACCHRSDRQTDASETFTFPLLAVEIIPVHLNRMANSTVM